MVSQGFEWSRAAIMIVPNLVHCACVTAHNQILSHRPGLDLCGCLGEALKGSRASEKSRKGCIVQGC